MTQPNCCAIAAGDPRTAEAGKIIFELGGNAFDATIAAILASFITEPTLTSAGGGGFLLAHTQDKRNILFDFFSQTPRKKRAPSEINFYPVNVNFGDATQAFHIGLGSMAVPSNLLGIFSIQRQLGRLPFSEVAQPAIHYAECGVELSPFQDICINQFLHPILLASPESKKLYAPGGELIKQGEKLYMKDFAATLRMLSQKGIQEFYQGEIARQLVKDCQEQGGYLTLEDCQHYRGIERKPLTLNYREYQIITNPPPSSGGILIAFALKLLETIELSTYEWGNQSHIELLANIMNLTNLARKDGYNHTLYNRDAIANFLRDEHLKFYREELRETTNKWGSTTHISAIDRDGNAASATTSNGEGSAYIIPGTDIMVNNMLGEEDLNPLGFHNWPCDRRISSMMSPTIILHRDRPVFVLGSGGSNRIRTAIFQVISNLIDFKLPIEVAIANSRIHWENGILNLEPPFTPQDVNNLRLPEATEVVSWKAKSMFFGGVHAVGQRENGEAIAAGDPRRGGAVAIL